MIFRLWENDESCKAKMELEYYPAIQSMLYMHRIFLNTCFIDKKQTNMNVFMQLRAYIRVFSFNSVQHK
jgi:hypothetical protein